VLKNSIPLAKAVAISAVAVADRLTECDDVGHHTLELERPHRVADPPEADLHLVGDAERSGSAGVREGRSQVARREDDLTAAPRDRFGDECCGAASGALHCRRARLGDRCCVPVAGIDEVAAEPASVRVGELGNVHVRSLCSATGPLELVRADLDEVVGVAVVPPVEGNDIVASGDRARHAQRQLVGLAARIDEIDDAERVRQRRSEPFRVVEDRGVQVPGVGVEHPRLVGQRRDHARVGMTDMAHVVHSIDVLTARMVDQTGSVAADDRERSRVAQAE
jgi:hypothetical protein